MPPSPFPPRPAPPRQDDPYGGRGRGHSRAPPNTPIRPHVAPNDASSIPRSILRPTPPCMPAPHNVSASSQISRPQPPPIPRSTTTSPYHHHHTSSSPELRPRVDNAWAPRAHSYAQPRPPDLSRTGNASGPTHASSHIVSRPRPDQHDAAQRRSGFAAGVIQHFVPGIRGRSASDVRITHAPPPDLDPDRLARACGQPALTDVDRNDDRGRGSIAISPSSSRVKNPASVRNSDASSLHPSLPKVRVGHMYRRLDALARRFGCRVMDYVSFEDLAVIHKRDNHLREQLRRKHSERLQGRDPNFHAIGSPLEDVLLYASTHIVIGEYQHHLPIVVVACVEELTKTGIYQSGLFRALPSRDRHLQLIDLFDKSPDFGANFNMRGQAMPDICALLSTFISSLPSPLLDTQIYSALWHWSVKPSVKREDTRRDQQEEEEEERRARGEPSQPNSCIPHNDLYLDDPDNMLETDQVSIAQILLRFLPSANLSLLAYLCGFFTQLPLCPENGLQLEDVARIFGHRLLGGSVKVVSQRMMVWLLTRWHRISETLFSDTCGLTPPPSPSHAPFLRESAVASEGSRGGIERRRGKRESRSDDALHHTSSSSSSHSSHSTGKSASDGEEGENSGGSRRQKKRELDVQEPRENAQVGRPCSTRKESRHRQGNTRRGSGSRRHHRHSSEHKKSPSSSDPFAIAFAKAQQDLADAPLLTNSPVAVARGEGSNESTSTSRSQFETPTLQRLDTPVGTAQFGNNPRRADVDIRVVDALLQETVAATDVARVLAERVEVLERALQLRRSEEEQVEHATVLRPGSEDWSESGKKDHNEAEDGKGHASGGTEDGLRLQLRLVEAERDKAQRIVRDVRAYLMDEGSTTMQWG